MAVSFTKTDLLFILQQIQMAESGQQPVNTQLAFGLRQLDGQNNNLTPGGSTFGAAGQTFPTTTQPVFQTVTVNIDNTPFDPHPGISGDIMTTTYASTVPGAPQAFGVNVIDPGPRLISNLIADQSANNPAAVAAQQFALGALGDGYVNLTQAGPDGIFGTPDDLPTVLAGPDGLLGTPDDITTFGNPSTPTDASSSGSTIAGLAQSLFIPNVAPDNGLSAPYNSMFTFFGQFFDHGLDLISKGGNGYVYIPIEPGDPLYNPASPQTNFMILTRATDLPGADGVLGTADDIHANTNQVTPFVDQNQTYASDSSHQVFLREYTTGVDGILHTTGKLLQHLTGNGVDGIAGTADDTHSMATWGDLKANALKFGLVLQDTDVGNVPLLATDAYGNYLPSPTGHLQVVVSVAGVNTLVELNPGAPVTLAQIAAAANGTVLFTGHPFINDMAQGASPFDAQTGAPLAADADLVAGGGAPAAGTYDNELLDAHYVAGDGRVNENIALTSIHEVFHDEHNREIDMVKQMVQTELNNGDTAFATDWVLSSVSLVTLTAADIAGGFTTHQITDAEWNGERLFQVAKFGTETQYQHLVFEEFARKVAPTIHLFGNVDIHLDPAITSEFANAVYRFGHSMLDETVNKYQLNADGTIAHDALGNAILNQVGLIDAFTNPLAYAAGGPQEAAALVQGSTHQVANEIDEFVTGALRNNLLGMPLDLAALNIARGRDVGVAPLNLVRAQLFDATQDQTLKAYGSWDEYSQFLKHPAAIVNFIAAYGTHSSIQLATTDTAKRAAALQLVTWGEDPTSHLVAADAAHKDAYDFMHSLGVYANAAHGAGADGAMHTSDDTFTVGGIDAAVAVHAGWSTGSVTGLDNVDLWIGGLAEKQNLFGGLLGSTFNFIFETQMEALQDGDRLYYLPRIEGMDFATQIENNTFAEMIQTNTGAKHLPADIFFTPEYTVEAKDYFLHNADGSFQSSGLGADGIAGTLDDRIATDPSTWLHNPVTGKLLVQVEADNTVHFLSDDNFLGNTMVLGGTDGNDRLVAGPADNDTVWGDKGNDFIDGGNGDDQLFGGDGNDTFQDSAGADTIHGDAGNDTIYGGIGDDLLFGGDGNDLMYGGAGIDVMGGGAGNDILFGGEDSNELEGNAGDDWVAGGSGGDLLVGDVGAPTGGQPLYSGNDVLDGGGGGDVMKGFDGDDIMFGEGGFDKFQGRNGYDWATFEKETHGVDTDMERKEFVADPLAPAGDAIRDVYTGTEGVSGSKFDDVLQGTNDVKADPFNVLTNVNLITNLDTFFPAGPVAYSGGNLMLGGAGNDFIEGRGGNDIIDGDAYLHTALSTDASGNITTDSQIIREIRWDPTTGAPPDANGDVVAAVDTAVYNDTFLDAAGNPNGNYTINWTPDAQGFITITHNGTVSLIAGGVKAVVNEGTDHLRNIERLQFADITISVDDPTWNPNAIVGVDFNHVATGAVTFTAGDSIPGTPIADPVSGTPLTVTSTVSDADLIAKADGTAGPSGSAYVGDSVSFQWQYFDVGSKRFVDITGATEKHMDAAGNWTSTYTPTDFDVANAGALRVMETYVDNKGLHERVFSAQTNPTIANPLVNTPPFVVPQIGTVGLADTAAHVGFATSIDLPLTVAFGDHETASNLLVYTAKIQGTNQALDGSAAAHGLTFTVNFDAAGLVTGATVTGTPTAIESIPITVTATDGGPGTPLTTTDTFLINVQAGNLLPIATPHAPYATVEDTNIAGILPKGTDADGPNPLTFHLVPNSAVNGTVVMDINGHFTFKPAQDFANMLAGPDGLTSANLADPVNADNVAVGAPASFQYVLNDGLSNSAPMTVVVNVTAIDDGVAPVTITGTAAKGDVLSAVLGVDPDAGPLPTTIDGYQWFVDGAKIVGETNADHTVTAADVGHNLSVQIAYHDAQGFAEAPSSLGVAAAAPFGAAALAAPLGLFIGKVGLTGVVPSGATPAIQAFNTLVDPDGGILPGSEIYSFQTSTDTVTWTNVAAASVSADGLNFIPTGTTTGAYVKVSLTYLDGNNNLNTANSDVMRYIIDTTQSHTLNGGTANGIVDDLIFGNGGNDLITAGSGNDFAQGGGGRDTFFAGVPGTPLPHTTDGNDTYDGGAGIDTYNMINTLGASTVNLTTGTATSAETGNDVLISIENVTGSAGDNTIIGSAAANLLIGNGGNDLLDGGSAGADQLQGGVGNDTYVVSHTGMTLTENNNQGTDTVQSSIAFTLGNNFENLVLTGVAAINGTGNNAANVLTGNDAHNLLSGLNGNDTFFISLGGDSYVGGGGVDTLNASSATHDLVVNLVTGTASGLDIGASTLSGIEAVIGGSGNDRFTANLAPETFTGGLGDDTFIFGSRNAAGNGATRSSILDFHQIAGDRDMIDLSGIDAINGGAHDAFIFDAVAKAGTGLEANGHLGYFHQTIGGVDHTIIEGNISGLGGAVDFQLDLLGNLALTAADFHL